MLNSGSIFILNTPSAMLVTSIRDIQWLEKFFFTQAENDLAYIIPKRSKISDDVVLRQSPSSRCFSFMLSNGT